MEFTVHEVVPEMIKRTAMGRVVVNPPNAMGKLTCHITGRIFMCCNRAYLTEDSYKKHIGEKKDHGKALDFSKLPEPLLEEKPCTLEDYDTTNRNLWIVRKKGCAKNFEIDDAENDDYVKLKSVKSSVTSTNGAKLEGRKAKKCPLCGLKIISSNLSRHKTHCHVPDGVKCDYCPCTFLLRKGRLRHQVSVHGIRIRNRSTVKSALVQRAKKQLVSSSGVIASQFKKGPKEYVCPTCGKVFQSGMGILDHMNVHSGARPHKCEICGYRFTHQCNLRRHMRKAHTKNDKIFCKICKCGFSNSQLLARHNSTMHPVKLKIKLPDSSKLNNSDSAVKKATEDVSTTISRGNCPPPNSSGRYKCRICKKELTSPQTWRGHMLIHQNLKPYKCQHCGISFRLHSTRNRHILNSHSAGRFKCKHCTCCFATSKVLDLHMYRYHSQPDQTKSKTTPDAKTVDKKENVRSPTKIDNVAGFKCNLCGTVVRLLEDFEAHKIVHNGSNPTQCNLCLKHFASSINVRNHKKRAHGDISISKHLCPFCCCRYTTSSALFHHLVKEHGMERNDWNFKEKCLKGEARRRIQLKLCEFSTKSKLDERKTEDIKTSVSRKAGRPLQLAVKGKESKGNDSSIKGHECDICHQRFKLARSINNHKKIAHNFGAYVCGLCPCRYHKINWLKKHELRVHGRLNPLHKSKPSNVEASTNYERKVECTLCKIKFKNHKSVTNHKKKAHFHQGKFKCQQCSCKFQVMRGLTIHITKHHRHGELRSPGDEERKEPHKSDDNFLVDDEGQQNENEIPTGRPTKNPKIFECDVCQMKFSFNSALSRHMRNSHFHSGIYKCSKCPCKFRTSGSLLCHKKLHQAKADKTSAKPRSTINDVFGDNAGKSEKAKTSKSARLINQDTAVECDLCHLMIHRRKIMTHKESSHGSGSYSCPDCTCVFEMPRGVIRHQTIYHKKKKNITDISDHVSEVEVEEAEKTTESPVSKVNLNFLKIRSSPISRQNPSKRSPGPVKRLTPVKHSMSESKQTKDKLQPSKTVRRTTTKSKHKCDLCGIHFATSLNFKRHLQKAHVPGGIPCEECPCTFNQSVALGAHKRVYHSKMGVDALKVVRAGKGSKGTISDADHVIRKKRVHNMKESDSSPVPMLNDDKEDVLADNLDTTEYKTRHKARSKVGNNDLACSTLQQNSKESKMESPSQSKTSQLYQCNWCSKSFSSQKVLTRHILSHERPETCQQCGMKFRNKDEVVKHIKVAHDKKLLHVCPVCTCRFATPWGLKNHHSMIHKKQSASYGNIVIEHDEGSIVDTGEPLVGVGSTFAPQNNIAGEFCEDSEPIIQGILETNYSSHADYDNASVFEKAGGSATLDLQGEMEGLEDSEPIVQGILEYSGTKAALSSSPPAMVENKKTFSPKSRPMKCSTCGITCYGPANLRLHMQSHHQENTGDVGDDERVIVDDGNDEENVTRKCDKCSYEFQSSSEMAQHLQAEHDESGLYRCAYCPCTMKTETNLRYHFMKYHT